MDWQLTVTLVVVVLAAAYILRRAVGRLAGKATGACSGCASCPAAKTPETAERFFIPADSLGRFPTADRSSDDHFASTQAGNEE